MGLDNSYYIRQDDRFTNCFTKFLNLLLIKKIDLFNIGTTILQAGRSLTLKKMCDSNEANEITGDKILL